MSPRPRRRELSLPVSALDHLIEGCQIIGFDYTYLYLNELAAAHGRKPHDELIGQTLLDVYPGIEHTAMFERLQRCMTERVTEHLEHECEFADGTRAVFALRIVPVREGACVFSLDVTERRQLVAARDIAESANRELEAFAYSVAHDLRAPLRHIDGFSGALLEDFGAQLGEAALAYLRRIRHSTALMARLIDDLLKLSQATSQELARSPIDLSALARATLARLQLGEPQRAVDVAIEPGLAATGDPTLVGVVLDNLIGNAWKFTAKRDDARIEISRAPTGFVVRDNGVGFAMTDAKNLFAPFQRLHAGHEFEGTGIGLATVQRIIQRHGGRVWGLGEVGAGAAFFFTLDPS